MPIQRAKPLSQLYADVADYDLVLVPDAPLASALNRRLDRPHFGTFATTPRRLAAGRREQAEDRVAFLEMVDSVRSSTARTDGPAGSVDNWKALAYAIGNVLQCWEHHGQAEAILDYESVADSTTEAVVEQLSSRQTTSQQLTEYTVSASQDVAVVGETQFTELEQSILPDAYDSYSLFVDEPFDLPAFNIFDSPGHIVDALLESIDEESADDVAVVLENGSQYSSLVESALESAGIPYYGGPGFIDDPDHRALLRLLRVTHRGTETTVAEVKPILTHCGVDVGVAHDGKRLAEVTHPALEWIQECCATVASRTFRDLLETYEREANASLDRFRAELETLGLLDTPVTADALGRLEYYVDSYEVPVDRENSGVLLADAKSAGYVDRPVVFYLGLDEGWTHSAPQRPWVDTAAQFERYIQRFQLLLQSGTEQYYLVQDTAGGQPVTPCLYFSELLAGECSQFSDLESTRYSRPLRDDGAGFENESLDPPVEPDRVETISQSTLNTYVNSPRDYLFSRLLDSPDADYFQEGRLFHDFAEFYVNHPDSVGEDVVDEVVELMCSEVRPFYPEYDRVLRERRYRIGLETIMSFLDANRPETAEFLTAASGFGTNTFAERFEKPVDSPMTERWFENSELGIKGLIDLVFASDHLLDYKSGAKKSAYDVIKQSAIDPPSDTVNYQALLYLTHYRTVRPDEQLEFTFFHFLDNLDDVIAGAGDLEATLTTVTYYPTTFDEYVASRDAYDELLDGYNDCVATFEDLGVEAYVDIVAELSFPETAEKSELRDSEFAEAFTEAVVAGTSGDVNAEKGSDQAIRALNGVRKRAYFREDLDRFETFIEERLAELDRRRTGEERFPIEGLGGEPNYRRVDHRDLLLEGER